MDLDKALDQVDQMRLGIPKDIQGYIDRLARKVDVINGPIKGRVSVD